MWKVVFGAALGLGAAFGELVEAASPYPQSTLITGMEWEVSSYRWTAQGSDIWPITWAAEGANDPLITAWGDGKFGCTEKASYGVAAITSDVPSTTLNVRLCGPGPMNRGKIMALLAAGSQLYARVNLQSLGPDVAGVAVRRRRQDLDQAHGAAVLPHRFLRAIRPGQCRCPRRLCLRPGEPRHRTQPPARACRPSTNGVGLRVLQRHRGCARLEFQPGRGQEHLQQPRRRLAAEHHLRPRPQPLFAGSLARHGEDAFGGQGRHLRSAEHLGTVEHRDVHGQLPGQDRRAFPERQLPDQVAGRQWQDAVGHVLLPRCRYGRPMRPVS